MDRKTVKKKRPSSHARSKKFHEDRIDREDSRDQLKSKTNDPSWYDRVPGLLENAASIPFSYAAGVPLDMGWEWGDEIKPKKQLIPGIITMSLIPTIGEASNPNSPVNIAATSMYSFVRHANSGRANYDSPDLMLYALALGQVYSYINWLFRIYGCANLYSYENRFLPRGLVEAQGVNFTDIMNNLANFRYGINALIHKAASLACPADMPYFRRLAFLFQNVYAEGESAKSQLYMYVPHMFLKYQETTAETGGELVREYLPNSGKNISATQLISYGNKLLDPILSSEDMNIMSGDILKAYGADRILKLATIPEVYITQPLTDLTVLEQFQNAQFVDVDPTEVKISQDVDRNCIVSNITWKNDETWKTGMFHVLAAVTTNHILTTILVNPKAPDVIERTRLMLTVSYEDDGTNQTFRFSGGTEVAIRMQMWFFDENGALQSDKSSSVVWPVAEGADNAVRKHCMLENFKFHPAIYYVSGDKINCFAIDLDNYTVVSERALERMNEAALLSLFDVSSIARFN